MEDILRSLLRGASTGKASLQVNMLKTGETIKAFVVLREGETLTAEEVITFCREKLAAYKVPKQVEFMEDLPKSTIGKVLRRKLREMETEKAKKSPLK